MAAAAARTAPWLRGRTSAGTVLEASGSEVTAYMAESDSEVKGVLLGDVDATDASPFRD